MAFSLGGGKGSSKSSMHQTVTPTNPSWVAPQQQTLATNTTNLSSQDPHSFVAGADPLQTQAAQGASSLGQNGASYATANNVLTGLASSPANTQADVATVHPNSILPNLQSYMDPFTNDVVNATLANFDRNAGFQTAQANLDLGQDTTFGGSGGGIYKARLASDQGLDRASTESGLRTQGFQLGSQLANQDADRRQQAQLANANAYNTQRQFNATQNDTALARQAAAAQGLVNTNQTQNADQRANIGLQGDVGSILQQIAQNKAQAPLTVQQAINQAYASLPLGLLHGQITDGTSKGKTTNFSAGYQS